MNYTFKDFAHALWSHMDPPDFTRFNYFAFLIQYDIYNLYIFKLAKKYMYGGEPVTRTRFYIGYKRIIEIDDEFEPDGPPFKYTIPHTVEKKILNTLAKYNKLKTWQLALLIRKKLQLEPEEKRKDYIGKDIEHYFYLEKFKIIKKEI
jgi:hypothetical protein